MLESLGIRFFQVVADSHKLSLIQQVIGDNEEFVAAYYPRLLEKRTKLKEFNANTVERGIQPLSEK